MTTLNLSKIYLLISILLALTACNEHKAPLTDRGDPLYNADNLPQSSQQTYEFSLPAVNSPNQIHTLADYRGRLVLVDFWASWCKSCKQQLPAINRLKQEIKASKAEKQFEVIAISLDDSMMKAQKFIEEMDLDYPVLLDSSSDIAARFQVDGVPSSFLFSPDGTLLNQYVGFNDKKMQRLTRDIYAELQDPLTK